MFTSTHLSSIPRVVWHEAIVIYSLHYSNCGVGIKLRQYIYIYIAVLKVVLSHAVITGATRAWSPWQLCQKLAWQGGWVQRLPSVRICWMCRDCPKLSVQHYSEKTTPSRFESVARPLAHSAAMKRQADGLPCKHTVYVSKMNSGGDETEAVLLLLAGISLTPDNPSCRCTHRSTHHCSLKRTQLNFFPQVHRKGIYIYCISFIHVELRSGRVLFVHSRVLRMLSEIPSP